jgi:hypothetical protein
VLEGRRLGLEGLDGWIKINMPKIRSFCYLPRLAIICIGARRYGGAGYGKDVGIDTLIKSRSSTQGSISLFLT